MMVQRWLLVLCTWGTLVGGRESPNAEKIKTLFSDLGSRYSNDIIEDSYLDVPGLISKYRYPIEVHSVITPDGYILEMHRIPHARDVNNTHDVNKPVVLLMHGLLCSSADWVLMGPGSGLAYILAEEGFDVWMGNARGNHYSRKHVRLNPDALFSTAFWDFSWDEIGNLDLPTLIDYVLNETGRQRLHYIGHSQGTTSFFVMTSLRPEYNEKIISMHALAPAAYMAHNRGPLLQFIAPFSTQIETITSLMGIGEFLPNTIKMTWAGHALCSDEVIFQPICSNIIFRIGGWNEPQLNKTMLPVIAGHTPAGSSVKQFAHYGQGIASKRFRRYDHGSRLANFIAYGTTTPPDYDLSKVTAPVFLHYSEGDPLVQVEDVDRLYKELGRPIAKFLITLKTFNHFDYIWGIDARTLLYNRVIKLINTLDVNDYSDKV